MKKTITRILAIVLVSFVCVACGGGGGGSTGGDPTPVTGDSSISTPTALNVSTVYSDTLIPAGTEYYEFTSSDGTFAYNINLSGLDGSVSWVLYSDPEYNTGIDICNQSSDSSDCKSPTLNAGTTYYLSLTNMSVTDNNFNICIEPSLVSEGTFDVPVVLSVDTPHVGTIGPKLYSSEVKSYYTFTTGPVDANYTISLSGATTDVKWELYPGTMGGIEDCDNVWGVGDESCVTKNTLQANTTYNLQVITQGPEGTFVTIDITEGGVVAAPFTSEGTVATPVVLTVDQAHEGTVAPDGTSYYQFTTGDVTASYNVKIERRSGNLEARIFTDALFTNSVDSYYSGGISFYDINWYTIILDPNSTYYLSLRDYSALGDEYKITVYVDALSNPESEGTEITPVVLTFDSVHNGTVGASVASRYQFTVNEPKPFSISVTKGTTDLSWRLVNDWSDIYSLSFCNNVYGQGDEICDVGTMDSGTTLYLSVNNSDNVATTFDLLITHLEGEGEGTYSDPVAITVGSPYLSSASANGSSFYEFTTGAEAMSYKIGVSGATSNMEWALRETGTINDLQTCDNFTTTADEFCNTVVLPADTTYRLEVAEQDGLRADFTVTVEGRAITNLNVDTPLLGHEVDGDGNNSYLKFTTDAINIDYTVRLTGTISNQSLYFYPDETYDTYFKRCGASPIGSPDASCTATGLALNTTYYLRVYTSKNVGVTDSFDLSVLADDFTDGTATSPVVLTYGIDHAGQVQANGSSYYQFTTTSGGPKLPHLISYVGESAAYVRLYDDLFTNQVTACNASNGSTDCLTPALLTGTTYYVRIDEEGDYSGEFTLNVTTQ